MKHTSICNLFDITIVKIVKTILKLMALNHLKESVLQIYAETINAKNLTKTFINYLHNTYF